MISKQTMDRTQQLKAFFPASSGQDEALQVSHYGSNNTKSVILFIFGIEVWQETLNTDTECNHLCEIQILCIREKCHIQPYFVT